MFASWLINGRENVTLFDNEIFNNCKTVVDTTQFVESCKVDYCFSETKETLKQIYEAFIGECQDILPEDEAVCSWKERLSYNDCPSDRVWSGCREQCKAYASCNGMNTSCSTNILVEGCYCPDGLVLNPNNDKCVPNNQFLCFLPKGWMELAMLKESRSRNEEKI